MITTEKMYFSLHLFTGTLICLILTEIGVTGWGVAGHTGPGAERSAEAAEGGVRGQTESQGAAALTGNRESRVRQTVLLH